MIYVTGDTHADWMSRLNTKAFPEQKEMTKDDYVIILGDFGIWDNSKREKYNLDWLEKKNFTTLFLDGNHENYDILDNVKVERFKNAPAQYLRPSVIHLMRGQVYEINGKKFFTFGGASSHDISDGIVEPDEKWKIRNLEKSGRTNYRINNVSWWEREMPNETEFATGLKNLRKNGNKVDYILTHSPCTSLLRKIDTPPYLYNTDKLTDYLEEIRKTVDFRKWLFGHMHINKNFESEKSACIYEQIIRIP